MQVTQNTTNIFSTRFYEKVLFIRASIYFIQGPIATKFRKGACENCGAMTHKKKDCLEVT